MPISFDCPECRSTIRAPESAAGQTGQCPRCNASVTIPSVEIISFDEDFAADENELDEPSSSPPNGKGTDPRLDLARVIATQQNADGRNRQYSVAYEKAVLMRDCGLNRESQIVLIDILVSQDASPSEKASARYLLGSIAFEENRVAVALKMWRQLVDEFPDSEEAISVRDRLIELAEVVGETIRERLDNAVASSYLSHADFWSRGKETCFLINPNWIDKLEAAIKWYDKILDEFPGSPAARIAYEDKLRALLGWEEPDEQVRRYGVVASPLKFIPKVIATFKSFVADFPNASTIQAFRFQIAQMYRRQREWDNATDWLNEIITSSGGSDSFYSDLAKRQLKKLEH